MAQSSDELIKREIIERLGTKTNGLRLKVFPQSSNEDQKIFPDGLTFGIKGVAYGSCDACWILENKNWLNPYNDTVCQDTPIIALEGTDALNRGSSGNAQYQRFHHALGAVKAGIIGIYYLRKGAHKIQEDLYGMAYFASKSENGVYLIIEDLKELELLLSLVGDKVALDKFIRNKLDEMYQKFMDKFKKRYGTWGKFAESRSTIIKKDHVIKFSGRMKRNFTDGSQRAGHIAVGEMYLTKYFFPNKMCYYLWPKMTNKDVAYLDKTKSNDKEWKILRKEPNVKIVTIDDLKGVPEEIKAALLKIKDKPLKGKELQVFKRCTDFLYNGLIDESITLII